MAASDPPEPAEDLARLELICGLAADALLAYYRDPSPARWRALMGLHRLLMLAAGRNAGT